ncbi:PAS and ANTAR domain-containing protein [Oryzihumus leptocrescens]|uniref:PAS and ANTAR domain-containing protein n=1 Tax=Oryzihumus leptocrescens TaxID=297536 RepID=UPI00163B214C|nr:PAS and ANTAR domain-containing protein [Oryzihumus leptocrescens]
MGGTGVVGALGGGEPQRVGAFVYAVTDQRWTWSEDLYRILGFAPGEVVPSTDLLLAHRHPDDDESGTAVVRAALRTGVPFSVRRHLVDARGTTRTVVVVGRGRVPDGDLTEVHGYVVDVTEALAEDVREQADVAIEAAREHRGALEQAKGAVMLALGVDADTAFHLLAAKSQAANVKVHRVAEDLVAQLGAGSAPTTAEAMTDWLCTEALDSFERHTDTSARTPISAERDVPPGFR